MNKKIIKSKKAPLPIGIYSQGVQFENVIYTSGQIPINPTTGKLICNDLNKEVCQILENIDSILNESGSSMQSVVKLTVFTTDLSYMPIINGIFEEYFIKDSAPARSSVEVCSLPMNSRVEIEAIAVIE